MTVTSSVRFILRTYRRQQEEVRRLQIEKEKLKEENAYLLAKLEQPVCFRCGEGQTHRVCCHCYERL